MGKLEIPLPELGKGKQSLDSSAKDLEARIRSQIPAPYRGSISVRPFRDGARTGLAIEYDDRAESFVCAAIEYPRGGKGGSALPRK
ncbi:MAG: hypothetical protein ACUVT7_06370 [Thermoplasmata archaeon]